jgi:hypothetical protein
MLKLDQVEEVKRLLGAGLSQRGTARVTGVSRGSVGSIASGEWDRMYAARLRRAIKVNVQTHGGLPVRCPGCGGKVYMPCRTCRLRALLASGRRRSGARRLVRDAEGNGELAIKLREPDQRRRYQALRRQKEEGIKMVREEVQVGPEEPVWDRLEDQPLDDRLLEAVERGDLFVIDENEHETA